MTIPGKKKKYIYIYNFVINDTPVMNKVSLSFSSEQYIVY